MKRHRSILLVIMSLVVYLFSLYNSPSEVTAELDNLTPNPSFENGGTQPEGWQGGGSGAEYSWADNTAHTGSRSVCIGNVDANKSGGWETISWIPVQEGKSYNYGVWVSGDYDRGSWLCNFFQDVNDEWMGGTCSLVSPNSQWSFYEREVTVPAGAASMKMSLQVENLFGGYTDKTICFDDVAFQEGGITPPSFCSIPDVPLIKQCSSPWNVDPYDHSASTICEWGCALTSVAMVINYHGASGGFSTTPRLLNDWLKSQPDGYSGALVNWMATARYARERGVPLYYRGRINIEDDDTLRTHLCNDNPVILRVPGHFVVATGEASLDDTATWTINDPGYDRSDLRAYPGNTYEGLRLFSTTPVSLFSTTTASSAMFIGTYPTVQFFVEDPQGRRTGLDPETDEVYSEIPGATYGPEYLANVEKADAEASPTQYTFEIFQPLDGAYTIRIGGSAEGKYTAYFFGYDEEETPSTAINVGQLSDGYPHTYLVYYSKDVGRQIDVKRVDQTYLPLVIFQD